MDMATGERVLVTGGSGYIAGFCIGQLLAAGHDVAATLRSTARAEAARARLAALSPRAGEVAFFAADLESDGGWAEAMAGRRYVLHVASPLPSVNPRDDDEIVRPARDGALRALRFARDAGVERVVMTSSTAAISYGRGGRAAPFTEADWSDETNRADSSAYERSKTIAERAAWAFMKEEGGRLALATVNPGAVLGPVLGDDFSASIDIVKKLLDGSLPGLPRFGWPLVDVRDVAALHVTAMTAPAAAGERFIAAGPFWWMADIAAALRQGLGPVRRVPRRKLPNFAVRLSALFDKTVRERLFELDKTRPVSAEKALRVLGWQPRPAAETVLDTARSLIERGIV